MSTFTFLLLATATLIRLTKCDTASSQASLRDNSQNCTCYTLDSDNTPAFFLYHKFYDFRGFATKSDQFSATPPLVGANQRYGKEQTQNQDVLNSSSWNNDWGIQDWGKKATADAPVAMQNSPLNVFIGQDNSTSNPRTTTHLTLRTTRLPTFQSTSEIENEQKNLLHASLRFRARVLGSPGAVAGLFTFYDDTNESDIEILTSDPKETYRYTNQPATKHGDDVPQASRVVSQLPPWNEWRDMRIDWLPDILRWFSDGEIVARSTYSVPRRPSGLVLNMWSDGGVWSGNMSVGESAELQIEWVQILFNTSGTRSGPGGRRGGGKTKKSKARRWVDEVIEGGLGAFEKGRFGKRWEKEKACTVICKVDGVDKVGFPQVAYLGAPGNAASRTSALTGPWLILVLVGVVSVVGMQ